MAVRRGIIVQEYWKCLISFTLLLSSALYREQENRWEHSTCSLSWFHFLVSFSFFMYNSLEACGRYSTAHSSSNATATNSKYIHKETKKILTGVGPHVCTIHTCSIYTVVLSKSGTILVAFYTHTSKITIPGSTLISFDEVHFVKKKKWRSMGVAIVLAGHSSHAPPTG